MVNRILLLLFSSMLLFGCNLVASEESPSVAENSVEEVDLLPQKEHEGTSGAEEEAASSPDIVSDESPLAEPQTVSNNVELTLAVNLDSSVVHTIHTESYELPSRWLNAWYSTNTYFRIEDRSSYNHRLNLQYLDHKNNHHKVDIYFRKIQVTRYALNTYWQILTFVDGRLQIPFHQDAELIESVNTNAALLQFDSVGQLKSSISARQFSEDYQVHFHIDTSEDSGAPHMLSLNFEDSTQYGAEFEYYIESEFPYPRVPPVATQNVKLGVNLDADLLAIPLAQEFDSRNAASFHHVTALTVYDSLGEPHELIIYFRKLGEKMGDRVWALFFAFDGVSVDALEKLHPLLENEVPSKITPLVLGFLPDGVFAEIVNGGFGETSAKLEPIALSNGAHPLELTLELGYITQYGANFSVVVIEQDGRTVSRHEAADN